MTVALVVALDRNGVIGRKGGLPWRLSSDLKRFKALTMGKAIVMGRKTWESIGKPLPGRLNIVVTRSAEYRAQGAETAPTLDAALKLAAGRAEMPEEICVIGGGEIYREAMPIADRLYVAHVDADVEGDTYFPDIDEAVWRETAVESAPAGERDDYPVRHAVYERIVGH